MNLNWRGADLTKLFLGNFYIGGVSQWQFMPNDPTSFRPWIHHDHRSGDLGVFDTMEEAKERLLTAAARLTDGDDISDMVREESWNNFQNRHRPSKVGISVSGGLSDAVDLEVSNMAVFYPDDSEAFMLLDRGGRFLLSDLRRNMGAYSLPRPPTFKKMAELSEQAVQTLYPYALVLACLDGNAFSNLDSPDKDLVRQYCPDALQALISNGHARVEASGNVSIHTELRQQR